MIRKQLNQHLGRTVNFKLVVFSILFFTGIYIGISAEKSTKPVLPSVFTQKNKVGLVLPPAVYAVPGNEINIYLDNIILVPNYRNLIFDVECAKGRQDAVRWRFTPTEKDVGSYDFHITITDGYFNLLAQGATKLIVVPANAGEGKKISILIVGDSLTNNSTYPRELLDLTKAKGNPELKLVGSHSGGGRPPAKGIAHEGYGGWTWHAFLNRWGEDSDNPKNKYRTKSKFLTLKDDKPTLDYQNYCDKYNDGQAPDFVTFLLGTNDVFRASAEDLEQRISDIEKYSEIFIKEILKVNPKTQIGIALTVPPASSQDAFGSNYKSSVTRWRFRVNQHQLVQNLIKKYGSGKFPNVSVIPTYLNIDCENNYPMKKEPINSRNKQIIARHSNGVHPAAEGYRQIADSIYYWMKFRLSQEK